MHAMADKRTPMLEGRPLTPDDLRTVAVAAREARPRRDAMIRAFRDAGWPHRDIARIAGVSVGLVSQVGDHRICELEENGRMCGRRHYTKGWCKAHYERWRRYDDPLGGA